MYVPEEAAVPSDDLGISPVFTSCRWVEQCPKVTVKSACLYVPGNDFEVAVVHLLYDERMVP